MMNYRKNHYIRACSLCYGIAAALALTACADWDDHYEENSSVLPTQQVSLWDNIQSSGNLNQFAELLRLTGYDKVLSASQTYTVWAPADNTFDFQALSAQGADRLRHEFVENHIARGQHAASGVVDHQSVYMLNEKLMDFNGAGTYTMQGKPVTLPNQGCGNGVIHVLNGRIPFLQNIYESLNGEQYPIDSISDFFHSYDVKKLNEQKSVQGPTLNGEITYLDSVFDEHNDLFSLYRAFIQREDSNYTMLMPVDDAWEKAKKRIASYYNYAKRFEFMENTSTSSSEKKVTTVNLNADYLRDSLTNLFLMRDLFFNNNLYDNKKLLSPQSGITPDSLVTTTGTKIYAEDSRLLLENAQYATKSNGAIYVTDSLRMRPWTSWCPEVVQEAEEDNMIANYFSTAGKPSSVTVSPVRRNPDVPGTISDDKYLLVRPSAATSHPEIDFYLKGVRSAEYSVYVVFVPANITDVNAKSLPNRMIITMGYADEKGKAQEQKMRNPVDRTNYFVTDPTKVDTVYLGDFTFPTAFYGTGQYYPYLRIRSSFASSLYNQYDRVLRIDCIILRPKELDDHLKAHPDYRYNDGKY